MKVGIPKEIHPEERRIAVTPRVVQRLRKMGFEVLIEKGAGDRAEFTEEEFREAGAGFVDGAEALWAQSDIVLKVREPEFHPGLNRHEADLIREGGCLIGFIWPAQNKELIERLAARKATVLAMDCIPRITRAQPMDALSAMANAAGYRAVVEAAESYPRFFSGQIGAAGKVGPAKVLVVGAGVAGLAAIGAARGLGAVVRAFDTRKEVGEQIRSMGAEFVEFHFDEDAAGEGGYAKQMSDAYLEAERALLAKHAMDVDIIITTALIPGKEAPKLITAGMVQSMRECSVIVDLAAQQGGNCTLTEPGKKVVRHGVRIIGYTDLLSRMAIQASWLYGSVLANFLEELGGAQDFKIDYDNEITRGALVLHNGELRWPAPRKAPAVEKPEPAPEWTEGSEPAAKGAVVKAASRGGGWVWMLVAGLATLGVGWGAPDTFLSHFTVFVLACVVGWLVVWNVTPALHTPLMSVTNAISGIIVIGGMLQLSGAPTSATTILGAVAVFVAAINIAGGFLVTRRMLSMFHR